MNHHSARKLCYLHFPKTAGTALATYLVPKRGDRLSIAQWQDGETDLSAYDWVHGHIFYDQVQNGYMHRPYLMTMLRNPIERLYSLYRFLGRKPELDLHDRVKDMTFREFVEARIGSNVYMNQLTGSVVYGDDNVPTIEFEGTPEARMRLARQRLANFDYVGITESFGYSMLLLSHDLGFEPAWAISTANSAPTATSRADIEPETLELIRQYAGADMQIYNYGLELFRARVRRMVGVL